MSVISNILITDIKYKIMKNIFKLIHTSKGSLVISDEEIKLMDYYITEKETVCRCLKLDDKYVYSKEAGSTIKKNVKKIIASVNDYRFSGLPFIILDKLPEKVSKIRLQVEYRNMIGQWISEPTILEICDRPMRLKTIVNGNDSLQYLVQSITY